MVKLFPTLRRAKTVGNTCPRHHGYVSLPIVTLAFIGLNVIMYAVEITSGDPDRTALLVKLGALDSATFTQSEYYRIIIAPFLHVSLIHLASNMVALLFVGWILEGVYGRLRFALVFVSSALVSSALSVVMIPNGVVIVGASGAIVGCFVALLVLQLKYRNTTSLYGPKLTLFLIICIVLSGFIPASGIDNVTHFGGIIGGSVVGLLVSPPSSFFSRIQDADPVLRRILRKTSNRTIRYGWTSLGRALTIALVVTAVFGTVSSSLYPRLQVSALDFSIRSSTLDGNILIQVAGNGLFVPEAAMATLGEIPLIVQIETNQTVLYLPGTLELHVIGVGSTTSNTLTIAIVGAWGALGAQATTPVYITAEQSINWVNEGY